MEKVDGKWWFVDPEGKLFWSHGMDCVEFGTQTRTRISDREHYFQYLPDEDGPEGKLYTYTAEEGDSLKWLSFHALNLHQDLWPGMEEDQSRPAYIPGFGIGGSNTIGNWSDRDLYLQRKTPYVLTAYTRKTGMIADPYAEGFKEDLIRTLKNRPEELGDPWCLGVFVDNELKWGVKWAPKIPIQIITAPPDQPAKIEFVKNLREKYRTIQELNNTWGTVFTDWSGILNNKELIPDA